MTISNTSVRKAGPSLGNGVNTAFPFTFKVFFTSDVLVTYLNASSVEIALVLGSDYNVTLNADQNSAPGGTVNLTWVPATGTYITLTSQVSNTQNLSLTNSGGFYPQSINDALDRIVIQVQQLAEQLVRAIKIPKSSTLNSDSLLSSVLKGNTSAIYSLAGTGAVTRTMQSKLQETISVKDFGAVCDGITDDSAAVQAALTYAGTLFGGEVIALGSMYCASSITIPAGVCFRGGHQSIGSSRGNYSSEFTSAMSLCLSNTATITLSRGATLCNFLIISA